MKTAIINPLRSDNQQVETKTKCCFFMQVDNRKTTQEKVPFSPLNLIEEQFVALEKSASVGV